MITIEVDEEVYSKLKTQAEPFVDTPNMVLRRLLFPELQLAVQASTTSHSTCESSPKSSAISSEVFAASFLANRYREKFRMKTPYRTMFESENHLVYFRNFNKAGTTNLWYRLSEGSLDALRTTEKIAIVCFTNPAEGTVFEIPMKDIDLQAAKAKWGKEFFEVNIDPASLRWRELDWSIEKYLVKEDITSACSESA